jgi:HD-GYP domain-containing protein (c-di-GMP phosphodiesterase class II)
MSKGEIRAKIETFLKELAGAAQVRGMYSKEHTLTQKAVNRLYYLLDDILFVENEVIMGVVGNEIVYDKEPFYDTSRQICGFIRHLKEIGALKIVFTQGAAKEEIAGLLSILSMDAEMLKEIGDIGKLASDSGLVKICLGQTGKEKGISGGAPVRNGDAGAFSKKNYETGEDLLREIADSVAQIKDIDVESVRNIAGGIMSNLMSNKPSLLILTAMKRHDERSFAHNVNVAIFSLAQAEAIGLEQGLLNEIGIAALLHDVGKVSIPREILDKKGPLTGEEAAVLRAHTVNGAKALLRSPDISLITAKAAFEHHVGCDHSGYPERLYQRPIDLATMMVSISDFYDTLCGGVPGGTRLAPEKVYDEMKKVSGRFFNEELLDNFFSIVGVYPPGTLVELDTGETGFVVKGSAIDIRRPQVEVLYGRDGEALADPFVVSLTEKEPGADNYKRTIAKSIFPSEKYRLPDRYR